MSEIALETVNSNIFNDLDGFICFPVKEITKVVFIRQPASSGLGTRYYYQSWLCFEYTFFCYIVLTRTIVLLELPYLMKIVSSSSTVVTQICVLWIRNFAGVRNFDSSSDPGLLCHVRQFISVVLLFLPSAGCPLKCSDEDLHECTLKIKVTIRIDSIFSPAWMTECLI